MNPRPTSLSSSREYTWPSVGGRRLRPTRRLFRVLAVVGVANIVLVVWAASPDPPIDGVTRSRDAAHAFLDRYVGADGRVARIDQGGDTVSEGQAYAMLLAVASGDRDRFERAWGWAETNLRRPDGLLAWRWSDGSVVDEQPASDADLDAAYALLLAWDRFGDPAYRRDALSLGKAILDVHVTEVGGEHVLASGPWARRDPVVVNPSYFFPAAFDALAEASGDERWRDVERSSYRILAELMRDPPRLPPEWAVVGSSGEVRAVGGPEPANAEQATFGFGAARIPVRLDPGCGRHARSLAASMWPFFDGDRELASVYDVRGRPVESGHNAVMTVAASAAARAAGHEAQARALLAEADAADRARPTYYGSAWVALGRASTEGLFGCRMQETIDGGDR